MSDGEVNDVDSGNAAGDKEEEVIYIEDFQGQQQLFESSGEDEALEQQDDKPNDDDGDEDAKKKNDEPDYIEDFQGQLFESSGEDEEQEQQDDQRSDDDGGDEDAKKKKNDEPDYIEGFQGQLFESSGTDDNDDEKEVDNNHKSKKSTTIFIESKFGEEQKRNAAVVYATLAARARDQAAQGDDNALIAYRGPVLSEGALGPVIKKLGNGAFGDVFQRTLAGTDIKVACKSIDPKRAKETFGLGPSDAHQSFLWEAILLHKAQACPFMVRFLGISHDRTQMVLEFCEGGELEAAVIDKPAVPLAQALVWALQIGTAVAALHDMGIIHKDLELENVLLTGSGVAKVADVGVSQADTLVQAMQATVAGQGWQDLAWASPELFKDGKDAVGAPADVFAFGSVVAAIIKGRRHFQGQSWRAFKDMIRDGRIEEGQPLDDEHPLTPLIRRCWSLRPEDRPSMTDVLAELRALASACFGGDDKGAAVALLEHDKTLYLSESRDERPLYLPPVVTDDSNETVVSHDQKYGEDVLSAIQAFRSAANGERVLVLIGDGGTGKSLGLVCVAAKYLLAVPLRAWLEGSEWTQSTLNDPQAVRRALSSRMSSALIDALRDEPLVVLVDALDELQQDGASPGNLPQTLLRDWPNAKLVVTCRRGTVPFEEHEARFGASRRVRYLLPFDEHQIKTYLSRRGIQDAAVDRTVAENPFVLRLLASLLEHDIKMMDELQTRAQIYDASVRQWLEHAGRALLLPAVREQLTLASFEAYAQSVAVRMFAADNAVRTVTAPEQDGQWARLDAAVRAAAEAKFDARRESGGPQLLSQADYVRQQEALMREFLAMGSPLQFKGADGTVSFMHKTFRDYFVGKAVTTSPEALASALVTQDEAVVRWAAEHVDSSAAACYKSPFEMVSADDDKRGHLLWDAIEASKEEKAAASSSSSIAAANAATILNVAGVPFSRRDLSGARLGPPEGETHDAPYPYADLGGAMLAGCVFRGANLRFARVQQACLDGADLCEANLEGMRFGEFANFTEACKGHDSTKCLAIDPSGTRMACGNRGVIRILEFPSGKLLQTLYRGHDQYSSVMSVAFDVSGTRIVSGCEDSTVCGWDVATGQLLRTLKGHTGHVTSVAIDPSGRVVSGGGYKDRTIRVWDMEEEKTLVQTKQNNSNINALAIDPSGTRIVSGSDDKIVRVWDLATCELLQTLEGHTSAVRAVEGHTSAVRAVAIDSSGTYVVSGSQDQTVRLWSLATGNALRTFKGHTGSVHAVAIDPLGTRIVSGGGLKDETVRVWDLNTGNLLKMLEGHTGYVHAVAVDPSGTRIVSSSSDATARMWDLTTGKLLQLTHEHAKAVNCIAIDPSGSRVVTGSNDKTVRMWDVSTGKLLQTLEGHTSYVYAVAIDSSGTRVVSGSWDKTVRVWDFATGELLQTLEGHTGYIEVVAVDSSGTHIASGGWDKTVRVWDFKTGELLHTLKGHACKDDCPCMTDIMSLSIHGQLIVAGSKDGFCRVWDLGTGALQSTIRSSAYTWQAVAVDPSGTRLVSGGSGKTVRVWDLSIGEKVQELKGHTENVNAVAIDPSGTRIVSGSKDKTVRVWDFATGELLQTLEGHTDEVKAVAIDPSGTRIVSGSSDKSVRLWDLTSQNRAQAVMWRTPPFKFSALGVNQGGASNLNSEYARLLQQRRKFENVE